MTTPTPIGSWGETFRIDDDGRLAVTSCNGDHVALEDDQWRHVITLLTTQLEKSPSNRVDVVSSTSEA